MIIAETDLGWLASQVKDGRVISARGFTRNQARQCLEQKLNRILVVAPDASGIGQPLRPTRQAGIQSGTTTQI